MDVPRAGISRAGISNFDIFGSRVFNISTFVLVVAMAVAASNAKAFLVHPVRRVSLDSLIASSIQSGSWPA